MLMGYVLAYFLLVLWAYAIYLLIRNYFVYKCRNEIIDAMFVYNLKSLKLFRYAYFGGYELPSYTKMLFSFKLLTPKHWLSKDDYIKLFETKDM